MPIGEITEPPCSIAEGILTCEFGDMDPQESHTVHISSPTNFENCPGVENTAVVIIGNGEGDEDTAVVDVNCPPIGIVLDKSSDQNLFHEGDVVDYTFDVTLDPETGEALTDITLVDLTFPDDCDPALVAKTGGDRDEWLEVDEVWSYSCQHTIGVGEDRYERRSGDGHGR